MIHIHAVLPNRHAELLALLPSATVQDLRTEAQQAFGKKHLSKVLFSKGLITAKNRVLVNFEQTLKEEEIEDGEFLTTLVLRPQLAATRDAFALWCHGDNEVVTWGRPHSGGDSSAVQDLLRKCCRFKPQVAGPLLRFWKMDPSFLGSCSLCR